jgi:hypothetical protein
MNKRCLQVVTIVLVLAVSLLGGGCAWKRHTAAICPDCGKPPCKGCKHAPDGPTGGYHCTIWRPLADPCWHMGPPVMIEDVEPEAASEGEMQPSEPLPPVYEPDTIPRY